MEALKTTPNIDFVTKLMYVVGNFYHSTLENTFTDMYEKIEQSESAKYIGELNKTDLMY